LLGAPLQQAEPDFSIDSAPLPSGSFRIARETSAPFLAPTVPNPARVAPQPPPVAPPTMPFAKPRKPANLLLPFQPSVAPAMPTSVAPALQSSVAPALPVSAPVAKAPAPRVASVRASGGSRLAAWSIDFGLLFLLASAQILLAARLTNHDWLDLALSRPLFPFWMVLLGCDAIACSWLFAAAGRTPGMLVLRQRLRTLDGGLPTPGEALQRALLSLLSAAPALFGFSFALFDSHGQTLHDKLCGCIVTID
jgi:RDD family